MRGGLGLLVIVALTALFSVGWFALMALIQSLSIGPAPLVFGIGLLAGSFLFGVVVSAVREQLLPNLVRRRSPEPAERVSGSAPNPRKAVPSRR